MYEEPKAPMTPLMPAIVEIAAEKPRSGWWFVHFTIREAVFEDYRVVAWNRTDREPRVFKTAIHCSDVLDPISKLHEFVYWILEPYYRHSGWYVDEEGPDVFLKCWMHGENNLQVHLFSEGRRGRGDFKYALLVDRRAFYNAFHSALVSFYTNGGWNTNDDWYGYNTEPDDEDKQELDCLSIDSGTDSYQVPDLTVSDFRKAYIKAVIVRSDSGVTFHMDILAEDEEKHLVLCIIAVHPWCEDADTALMTVEPYGRISLSTFVSNSMEWWAEGSDILLRVHHTNGVPTNEDGYRAMPVDVRISRENFREIVSVLRTAADR